MKKTSCQSISCERPSANANVTISQGVILIMIIKASEGYEVV